MRALFVLACIFWVYGWVFVYEATALRCGFRLFCTRLVQIVYLKRDGSVFGREEDSIAWRWDAALILCKSTPGKDSE